MADTKLIEVIKEELERLEKERELADRDWNAQITVLKGLLEQLRARPSGEAANNGSSGYMITSFKGMSKSTALEIYMRGRRSEGITEISVSEILQDLLDGGAQTFNPKEKKRWEASLVMIANQNHHLYEYDCLKRTIKLSSKADGPLPPKPPRRKAKIE